MVSTSEDTMPKSTADMTDVNVSFENADESGVSPAPRVSSPAPAASVSDDLMPLEIPEFREQVCLSYGKVYA